MAVSRLVNTESDVVFSEQSDDERLQMRYAVDCSITVTSENNFYAGSICNLSGGGVFIATHIVHPVGTRFNISIHLDDAEPGVVRGLGEVRWLQARGSATDPQGLGIRFVELKDEGQARVMRFLQKREPLPHPPSSDHLVEAGAGEDFEL